MPFLSVRNISDMTLMGTDAVRRKYHALRKEDLVIGVQIGMTEPKQTRILPSLAGIELAYETGHIHPTTQDLERIRCLEQAGENQEAVDEFRRRCDFTHYHDPFGGDDVGHEHPPWTASQEAGWPLAKRLPRFEAIYRVAPTLLRSGDLKATMPTVARCRILGMTDLWWLRSGRLYEAVALYGDDVMVEFTYVGPQVTETQLREKRRLRFRDLVTAYQPPGRPRRIWNRNNPDGPPTPTPSAHVVIAADAFAMDIASRVFPTAAIRCADGSSTGSRTYQKSFHVIRDRATNVPELGRPEQLGERMDGREDLTAVLDMPSYRMFLTISKFPGMSAKAIGVVAAVENAKKTECLTVLEHRGLAFQWRERYYLDRPGMMLVARMNRVSPSSIYDRFKRYLEEEFREDEHNHDDGVNSLVVGCAEMGVEVEPGWRRIVHPANRTQVRPDAWVYVKQGPLGTGWHGIEYELSARSPSRVSRKLRPYSVVANHASPIPLLVVCATERAESNFLRMGMETRIPMMTCTADRAKVGPLVGQETVWRHQGTRLPRLVAGQSLERVAGIVEGKHAAQRS